MTISIYSEITNALNSSFTVFLYSLIGGLIPALFWLWFWMHEDNKHKEPRKIILFTFVLGMLGVFVSFLLQKSLIMFFNSHLGNFGNYINIIQNNTLINLIFVIIEEFIKFVCAYTIFFRSKLFDEPIDAFIYLMTAAIGFSAMENTLYLIKPILDGQTIDLIINSNLRFIGANVLHVASSGILALFIGYAFCKKPFIRETYIWIGLVSAITLHWIFNFILIKSSESMVFIFSSVWIIVIFLIISLEKIKKIKCVV